VGCDRRLSFLDARSLEPGFEFESDVCVVGAGAAGITLAVALAERGRDVCLLEAGGERPEESVQSLNDLDNVGYPVRENFMSRARYFGGSCNLWAGRSMKLAPFDLTRRAWVARSGWPMEYSELARYYPEAASVLRLPEASGFDDDSYSGLMSVTERRIFSGGSVVPTVSLWAKKPLRFGRAHRARLAHSACARTILNANVTTLNLSGDGARVRSVSFATLTGTTGTVRARVFVLACGGIENARLLLSSTEQHPAGVGNAHDLVGRYFMDHPRAVHGKVRLRPGCDLSLLGGRPLADGKVQIGLGISQSVQREEGLLHHYATLEQEASGYTQAGYQSLVRTGKVLLRRGYAGSRLRVGRAGLEHIPGLIYLLTPKELLPHWAFRMSFALRPLMARRRLAGDRVVVYFCEQPPDPESRVTLSRERDALGVPKAVLHWKLDDQVERTVLRLQQLLKGELDRAGIGTLEIPDEEIRYTDASHHMGTTRMGATPRDGVVDTDCRVHGVNNLYVAGSSVFPSAGHANPTLTIVALALRMADRLA